MRLRRLSAALATIVLGALAIVAPLVADATMVAVPNTFVNGEYPDASLFNNNFGALVSAINGNIDNSNIGPAGIFASQIIPGNTTQATFGGTQAYTFTSGVSALSLLSQGNIASANGVFAAISPTTNNGIAQLCAAVPVGNSPACLNVRNNGDVYSLGNSFNGGGKYVAPAGLPALLCSNNSCATALTVDASGNGSVTGAWSAPGGVKGSSGYNFPVVAGDASNNEQIVRRTVSTSLSGFAIGGLNFTSASTYTCVATNETTMAATQCVRQSGAQASVFANSSSGQTVDVIMIGN